MYVPFMLDVSSMGWAWSKLICAAGRQEEGDACELWQGCVAPFRVLGFRVLGCSKCSGLGFRVQQMLGFRV